MSLPTDIGEREHRLANGLPVPGPDPDDDDRMPYGMGPDPRDRLTACMQDVYIVSRAVDELDEHIESALRRIHRRMADALDDLEHWAPKEGT